MGGKTMHSFLRQRHPTTVGIASGIIITIAALLTNIIMHQEIKAGSDFVAGLTYITVGAWLLVLFATVSYFLDENRGEKEMTKETWKLAAISGVATAIGLIFSLRGNQVADASVNLQFESLSLVYIALWQALIQQRVAIRSLQVPLVLSLVGGYFAVLGKHWAPNWDAVLWVLCLYAIFNAILYLTMGDGSEKAGVTKFLLWRYVCFALAASVLSVGYIIFWGNSEMTDTFRHVLTTTHIMAFVIASMFLGYLYVYLWNLAADPSRESSITHATLWKQSIQLILIGPSTWLVAQVLENRWGWFGRVLMNDPFGELPPDWVWYLRILCGVPLVVYGLIRLRKKLSS